MNNLATVIAETPYLSAMGHDYPAIAAWLNEAPLIDNPIEQPQVTKPCSIAELFAILGPEDTALLPTLSSLLTAGQNVSSVAGFSFGSTPGSLLEMFKNLGLSEEGYLAISSRLAETEPDPNWLSQIPGTARREGLGFETPITAEQVQDALNQ